MILDIGEKVFIIERRYFAEDLRRHFIGEITRSTESVIRVTGYAWVFDNMSGKFIKKPEKRERVIYLGNRLTVLVIPSEVNLDEVKYTRSQERNFVVTDGKKLTLDITEFIGLAGAH